MQTRLFRNLLLAMMVGCAPLASAETGIAGRKIKLVSLDDGYDTSKALKNTRRLVEQDKVFAIFGQFGTGITQSSLPLTTAAGIPLFAPYTGADALRDNANRYLFHIRASYGQEMEKMVEQLVGIGIRDIAVVYQNDSFGKAGLLGAASHGIAIAQVMPSPWRSSNAVVREYQQVLAKANTKDYSYTALEGFIAAKIFVEALKRTGKDLTREKLIASLEGMRNYDAGGLVVDFGPKKRNDSTYVDLSIISKDGQFLR